MNPFLGYRALRILPDEKDLFRTQLRALSPAAPREICGSIVPYGGTDWRIFGAQGRPSIRPEASLKCGGTAVPPGEGGNHDRNPRSRSHGATPRGRGGFLFCRHHDLTQYTLAADPHERQGNQMVRLLYHPVCSSSSVSPPKGPGTEYRTRMCGEMAGDLDRHSASSWDGIPGTLHAPPRSLGETARAGALHRSCRTSPGRRSPSEAAEAARFDVTCRRRRRTALTRFRRRMRPARKNGRKRDDVIHAKPSFGEKSSRPWPFSARRG
jgi:hypothetical protein